MIAFAIQLSPVLYVSYMYCMMDVLLHWTDRKVVLSIMVIIIIINIKVLCKDLWGAMDTTSLFGCALLLVPTKHAHLM